MMPVISTKKLKPALVAAARAEGFLIQDHDFIQVDPVPPDKIREALDKLPDTALEHIAFTSAHAVESLYPIISVPGKYNFKDCKIFCLSGRTKEAVIALFNENKIVATADNAAALAEKILEQKVSGLVFFCGNQRRDELPALLKASGVQVQEIVVYKTVPKPVVTPAAQAVLFFSPSAVESFFSANRLETGTVCFAIGETTAGALKEKTAHPVVVSEAPSQESVLASLFTYFKHKNY